MSITALMFGSQRMRSVLLAFGTVCLVVPTLITASQARALKSIVWEGKDGMPLWVGLPILAVGASATWWSDHPRMGCGLIGAAGVAQFAAFLGALHRYTVGAHGSWTMIGSVTDGWSPPLPALLLVGLYAVALIVGWRVLIDRPSGARRLDLRLLSREAKGPELVRRMDPDHLSSSRPKDEPVNWYHGLRCRHKRGPGSITEPVTSTFPRPAVWSQCHLCASGSASATTPPPRRG